MNTLVELFFASVLVSGCSTKEDKIGYYFVGTATMDEHRAITLKLASREDGLTAHAQYTYAGDHKDYENILAHVGKIRPGETKPIEPWE